MEVFNKLYSSVTQTVSQLSSVLPGNPVTREYDITGHIASAGRGCMWKIYSGTKKSTGQEASIFLLEKRLLERYSKEDREEIFEIVRRGVTQITKIRHPQVLTVQHPLEESRESFAFATEPVYASLANVLGDTTNIPASVISELGSYSLYETEIKYGLLQLIEGIQFIHNETKLVHRNISPHSVVLNSHGIWKIFGFDYCASNENANRYDYNPNQNILAIPSLEYTAPECVLENAYSSRADYYSLAVLICAIYSKKCNPFKTFGRDYTAFKKHAQELRSAKCPNLMNVPQAIRSNVEKLLTASPERRPDLVQLSKVPYFDDIGVKSLSYLDTLFQRDNQDKAKFYKGLPQIIKMLPARINLHRILTCLVKEFIHPTMIPFVLPNVLLIAESCSKAEYEKHIFPHIKAIMSLQDPVQILLIFMQNMELLLKLTAPNDVKLYVLPMVYKALESSSTQVQELCLAVLPSFANLIDYPSMKNSLLPRIKHLCSKSSVASVRVNCLLCVGQLLPQLDKWLVLDDILMFLPTVTPREPAVIMAIIGIYKVAANHEMLGIPKEFAANKVLPFLWPLSIENGLTLPQYNVIMAFITELSSKVQAEHMRKLEQLNTGNTDSNPLQYDILAPSKTEIASSDDNPIDIITKDFVDKSKIEKPPSRPLTLSEIKPLENSIPKMNVPATAPIKSSFSLPTTQPAQFVPPSTFQQMPMWQQQRPNNAQYNPPKAFSNGNQSFDQFQALLPPTSRSITVDVAADVKEILAALVTVANSVNASVSNIFSATQDVVTDDNTARVHLFGRLCKALQEANDLNSVAAAMDVFVHNLDSTTNTEIASNMTGLDNHKNTLKTVFRTISNGVKAAEKSQEPVTNANVGNFITPAMVTSLADGLSSITACVNNIADLFTKVINNQMDAAAQVAKVNASANAAVKSLAITFNEFSSKTVESCRTAVQTEKLATSNIVASFSPIQENPKAYNGGDISNLNSYIETLMKLNTTYAQSVINHFETVQASVFEMLTIQTQRIAVTLYNATKSIVYADVAPTSQHVLTCTSKYVGQLTAPPVQVSRLSSCLTPETDTLLNYDPMLAPLVQQLQKDASAISSDRVQTCTRSDGPCSAVYFSAYEGLAVQVEAQLKNLNTVLGNELRFLQDRVETCVTAVTADISDNIQTIQTHFSDCLTTGQ